MKNKKYIMCSGLAFGDSEDMEMLHAYALEGWIFREFQYMCYVLHKEESQDLIFSYDLSVQKEAEQYDYYRFFEEAGWKQIPYKNKEVHFFYAKAGTIPIHSDQKTRAQIFQHTAISSVLLLLTGMLLFLIAYYLRGNRVMIVFAGIGGACVGGGLMSAIGSFLRVKQKRLAFVNLSFKKALVCLLLGMMLILVFHRIWPILFLLLIGLSMVVYGGGQMFRQYPLYRDHKEVQMKKRKEEIL